MKSIKVDSLWCLLLVLLRLISFEFASATSDDDAWNNFKTKFNKKYSSSKEEENRKSIFLENLQFIESHNTKALSSFKQGINNLSDMGPTEVVKTLCGLKMAEEEEEPQLEEGDDFLMNLLTALNDTMTSHGMDRGFYENLFTPTELDWREKGRVSRVKDQGRCGSCWAYATTGALEGFMAAKNRPRLLSEQNLVDCSRRYKNEGCNGGMIDWAMRYIRDYGLMVARDYPYTGHDEACKFRSDKSVIRLRGLLRLPRGNEALLRMALAIIGPIPVSIDSSPRSFHNYQSGVYNEPACNNTRDSINHAMLLVGYGVDNDLGEYWIVKNSWGTKWGDRGYIKMSRNNNNQCGIATYAVMPIP